MDFAAGQLPVVQAIGRRPCIIWNIAAILAEMVPLRLRQTAPRSSTSIVSDGRSIAAGYFSCQSQLELKIRQVHLPAPAPF